MDFSAGAFNRAEQLPVGGQQDQGREGWEELSVGGNEGGEEAQEEEEEAAEGRPRGGDHP